jgi:hypothetical protein
MAKFLGGAHLPHSPGPFGPRRNGEAACLSSLAPGPRIVTLHAGLGSKRSSPSP